MPNDGISMKDNSFNKFDFILMVNNEDFDNDDNPYGQFILH